MSFTTPVFNRAYRMWLPGNATTNPPDLSGNCQLYLEPKGAPKVDNDNFRYGLVSVIIRLPANTFSGFGTPQVGSIFAIQDSVGTDTWYYTSVFWEACHQGFPNEYTQCVVLQCDSTGVFPDPAR
jgi:hypothetical protein